MESKTTTDSVSKYFDKYDGKIETHKYGYRILHLNNAVNDLFPTWEIMGEKYEVAIEEETRSPVKVTEQEMNLHSSYSEEQHSKSVFGKLLRDGNRIFIVSDCRDYKESSLDIYEPSTGCLNGKSIIFLYRTTSNLISAGLFYYMKKITK